MTSNQIAYWQYQEAQRSNLAKEAETARANKAREFETGRNNLATEKINQQNADSRTREVDETMRSNLAKENETRRSNLAREEDSDIANAETERANRAKEQLSEADSIRKSQTSIQAAQINAAASRYGANKSAQASKYGADSSARSSRYSADSSAAASRYNADKNAESKKYDVDTRSLDAYKARLTETAQKGYDRANQKEIQNMRNDGERAIKSLEAYQKQLDRNSKEYIALQQLKEQIRKNNQDYDLGLANTIVKGLDAVMKGAGGLSGLAALLGG